MIKKTCQNTTYPITKDVIDKMVDNIYINIEGNDMVQVNLEKRNTNITNDDTNNKSYLKETEKVEPKKDYRSVYNKTYEALKKEINEKLERKNDFKYATEPKRENRFSSDEPKKEVRFNSGENGEDRQFNRGLSDLIRILLIRELTGRPIFPGNRPPYGPPPPPPPGRPPYGPPQPPPPGRPPYGAPPFR